jgi:Flp pilus assembly protein TadD
MARGRVEEAIAQATEACRVARSDLAAWEQLASIFSDVGDADRLDATVEVMRRLGPRHGATLYYDAAARFLHGQLQPALERAREAVAADGSRAAAHNLLGAIHASLGSPELARTSFTAAMELNPRDTSTYTNLAMLELNLHNAPAASRWFAEALSLDPTLSTARDGLLQARGLIPDR